MATPTGHTAIGNDEEFRVPARIGECGDVHLERTRPVARAGAAQQKLNIDVAVPRVRDVAQHGHPTVVAAVTRRVEDKQLGVGLQCVVLADIFIARDLEQCVETGVSFPGDVIVVRCTQTSESNDEQVNTNESLVTFSRD